MQTAQAKIVPLQCHVQVRLLVSAMPRVLGLPRGEADIQGVDVGADEPGSLRLVVVPPPGPPVPLAADPAGVLGNS